MKWIIRIAGVLLLLIVVLVVGLFAAGQRDNAGKNYAEVVIDRPPATVFPWLTDADRLKQWVSGFVDATSGDRSLSTAGAQATILMNVEGQPWQFQTKVLESSPTQRLKLVFENPEFDMLLTVHLDEETTGTRVKYGTESTYKNFLFRLLEPLAASSAQQKLEKDLSVLKQKIESQS